MKYWIQRWTRLREKELIAYPNEFPIHDVYRSVCTQDELKSGSAELRRLFELCYEAIIEDPSRLSLPIYDMGEYGYFSKEARTSREASYKLAKIFCVLGYAGELTQNGALSIQSNKLKEQCKALKITNLGAFLNILETYGMKFEGLVHGTVKSNSQITVFYPDNRNVISALYILAVKANNTGRFKDFCRSNYRLFEGDWDTAEYGSGVEAVSDLFHSEEQREAARLIHEELLKRNYCYSFQEWNEGPQIRYYKKESDRARNANADFWLTSMDTEFVLYFRINTWTGSSRISRNAPKVSSTLF